MKALIEAIEQRIQTAKIAMRDNSQHPYDFSLARSHYELLTELKELALAEQERIVKELEKAREDYESSELATYEGGLEEAYSKAIKIVKGWKP